MLTRNRFLFWFLAPLFLGLVIAIGSFAAFQIAIRQDPNSIFTREGILKILARESVVFYADGQTKVGTFFEGTHRDYVPFDSVPKLLVEALISAEDQHYWTHGGMDFKAIAYAMLDNLKSGSMKRGGSTLTQQTSKNLFRRRGRTLMGKIDELINAYRLERHFSKQEILEFYLNQFYVAGNGHGVRIAARYFFNKELKDLNLSECAFIAGSVKGPNKYNPFLQATAEKKEAALKSGRFRVAYVLKQMRLHEKISEQEYRQSLNRTLEFRRGQFRFTLSTHMVGVQRLLESPEMQDILSQNNASEYMTAGLQIYTTMDAEIQKAAEYAVYSNLGHLDLLLRGYRPPTDSFPDIRSHFTPGEFITGRIDSLEIRLGVPYALHVHFGPLAGVVPDANIEGFFRQWNRHEIGGDALPTSAERLKIAARFLSQGQLVFCAVPYRTPQEIKTAGDLGQQLDLLQKPMVQGAAEVIQEGRVLANVGGFGNTGYDRVNQAQRQFGSAFKPLVFASALELGWRPLDAIPNYRQLFRLGDLFYFPKPDHHPEDTVSMAWACRRSENLASIGLLFRLFDKVDFARFWKECRGLGLAPENFPIQEEFGVFVRDSLGLVLNDARLRELRYQKIANDLVVDLTFDGKNQEAENLSSLQYGAGFARERQQYLGSSDAEDKIRIRLLNRNYLDITTKAIAWRKGLPDNGHFVLAKNKDDGRLSVFDELPDSSQGNWIPVPRDEITVHEDSLWFEGEVTWSTLTRIADALRKSEDMEQAARYTKENLFASPDFRALASLRYVVQFSRKLGMVSKLDPVLSFPLGVNSITLSEAANVYQAMQDGFVYRTKFGRRQLYIDKITTFEGQVIFQDQVEREQVITERTRYDLESILGSVVQGGTGQRIGKELKMPLGSEKGTWVAVPAYGKTGTTNDYRNAAFLGFLAAPKGLGKGFEASSGFTIATYTGFDDNTGMVRKGFRGTGASAAIPAWLGIAQSMVKLNDFSHRVDTLDLEALATGMAPQFQSENYKVYPVSRRTGLPATVSAIEDREGYAEDFSAEMEKSLEQKTREDKAFLLIRED